MNIFDYFFSCFHYIINVLDHDFFGLGFSYLDFILAASLIFIILRFLLQGFNETDKFNFFSFTGLVRDYGRDYQMSHKKRETQLVNKFYYNDSTKRGVLYNTEITTFPDGHKSIYTREKVINEGRKD